MELFLHESRFSPSPVSLVSDLWIQGAFSHQGVVRSLFTRAKFYADQRALKLLLDHGISRLGIPGEKAVLLPVPPNKRRLLKRGQSMADRMAVLWGRSWGLPCNFNAVSRKDNLESKLMGRSGRVSLNSNDRWSFVERLDKSPVVLVDDLATTGWTLKTLAQGLEERGVFVAGAVVLCVRERFHGDPGMGVGHEA